MNYKKIVNSLEIEKVNPEFWKKEDLLETIHERLKSAYEMFIPDKTDKSDCFSNRFFFGINQCIHLASSIVLLGTREEKLKETLHEIGKQYSGIDPTSVVSIAMLYYILIVYMNPYFENTKEIKGGLEKWNKIVKNIDMNFNKVNWMIGEKNMNKLKK